MDEKDLKIQALLERISTLTSTYEDRDADRRVEYTILNERYRTLEETVQRLTEGAEDVSEETTQDSE